MKITKEYLKRVIKEELEKAIEEEVDMLKAYSKKGDEILQIFKKAAEDNEKVARVLPEIERALSGGKNIEYIMRHNIRAGLIQLLMKGELEKENSTGTPASIELQFPVDVGNAVLQYGIKILS